MQANNITNKLPQTIRWENGELYFLDQTQLPLKVVEEKQETAEQVWNSIKVLKVRGAPAIGIAAAYGLLITVKDKLDLTPEKFLEELKKQAAYLDTSRPTAVNLSWALKRMLKKAQELSSKETKEIYANLTAEAQQIHDEDRQICRKIAEHGAGLIKEGMGVLTHCNAGSLAVSELGTATAPIYLAHANGVNFRVYADETRPLLQGARLTSWELQQAGVDVTLICDNMAAYMMNSGLIDLVIVGTDRVAANGDVANKIGTLGVAILAKYFSIPFYVACPYSTIDLATQEGKDIKIEERHEDEVTNFGLRRTAPEGIKVRNPAFDVTPNELVTGIITEKGILTAPYKDRLVEVVG
jgi:methylthioribose-1-phosphate isomerase